MSAKCGDDDFNSFRGIACEGRGTHRQTSASSILNGFKVAYTYDKKTKTKQQKGQHKTIKTPINSCTPKGSQLMEFLRSKPRRKGPNLCGAFLHWKTKKGCYKAQAVKGSDFNSNHPTPTSLTEMVIQYEFQKNKIWRGRANYELAFALSSFVVCGFFSPYSH